MKNNQTQFVTEVAGDPEDPDTELRRNILEPLSLKFLSFIEKTIGSNPKPMLSALPKGPQPEFEEVMANHVLCEKCSAIVAVLFYADNAKDDSYFNDYLRLIFPKLKELNVPTWIIGPESPCGLGKSKAKTLKIWPEKQLAIETLDSDTFNKSRLSPLILGHC